MDNKHCSTCYNDDNESIFAMFEIFDRKHKAYRYLCRRHMMAWFDIFTNTNILGLTSFIIRQI